MSAHARFASIALHDSEQTAIELEAAAYMENLAPARRSKRDGGPLCAVHLVDENALCQRMNTLQHYLDVNRELANRDAFGARLWQVTVPDCRVQSAHQVGFAWHLASSHVLLACSVTRQGCECWASAAWASLHRCQHLRRQGAWCRRA